jgi:hypothetical protein
MLSLRGLLVSELTGNHKGGTMKKWFMMGVVSGLFFFSSYVYAAGGYNMAGCGLGAMFIKDPSRVAQIIAATVNNLISPQTFAITSGTSECYEDGMVKSELKLPIFASVNFESLKQEMAQGQGEYLTSLATLIGIPVKHHEEFFTMTQEKYASFFRSETTTSKEMLVALNEELSAHPLLVMATLQ